MGLKEMELQGAPAWTARLGPRELSTPPPMVRRLILQTGADWAHGLLNFESSRSAEPAGGIHDSYEEDLIVSQWPNEDKYRGNIHQQQKCTCTATHIQGHIINMRF